MDGEIEGLVSFPVVHDNIPNEGCQIVTVSVTAVSGTGSAAVDGGIHDVSADAVVMIEEDDFTSAVLETVPREILEPGSGELSPATAEVQCFALSKTDWVQQPPHRDRARVGLQINPFLRMTLSTTSSYMWPPYGT